MSPYILIRCAVAERPATRDDDEPSDVSSGSAKEVVVSTKLTVTADKSVTLRRSLTPLRRSAACCTFYNPGLGSRPLETEGTARGEVESNPTPVEPRCRDPLAPHQVDGNALCRGARKRGRRDDP